MGSRAGHDKSMGRDNVWLGKGVKMPDELRYFINLWTKKVEDYTDYEPLCPIKNANIVFQYKKVWYIITPESIGITEDTVGQCCWVNEKFEDLAGKMENELVDLGAEDVFYGGMID
jgi:hypothetical protein